MAKLISVQDIEQSEYYSQLPLPEEPIPSNDMPSPDDPPWGVGPAIGVWLLSVLLILIVPSIFLLPYLASLDPPVTDPDQVIEFAKSDPFSILLQIIAIIPAHIITILVAWAVVTRARKFSFKEMLGWEKGGFAWWHYCIILLGFVVMGNLVTSIAPEQDNDLLRILQSSRAAAYLVAFVATFTAPLVEEVTYRGVLYSAFKRKYGVTTAFILATFLFSVVHWPQYWPSYSTIFLLTLLSVTLTAVRIKSKNLLPCIILHTLFNGLQSVLLIVEPYVKSPEGQEKVATILQFLR